MLQTQQRADFRHGLIGALLLLLCLTGRAEESELRVAVEKTAAGFVVRADARLHVPLPVAWAVLTDFDHMTGIMSNLSRSTVLERRAHTLRILQEGRAWYGPFFYTFVTEREVTLEPMQRIRARQISGTAQHFASLMELSRRDDDVALSYRAEIDPGSALAKSFGSSFVQHEIEEQLRAMMAEMIRRSPP